MRRYQRLGWRELPRGLLSVEKRGMRTSRSLASRSRPKLYGHVYQRTQGPLPPVPGAPSRADRATIEGGAREKRRGEVFPSGAGLRGLLGALRHLGELALRRGHHDALIRGGEQALQCVERLGVSPDEHAASVSLYPRQNDLGGVFRRDFEHLLELPAAGLEVLDAKILQARVHARAPGDVRLDAARVHAGRAHGRVRDLELFTEGFGEAADGELGRVVRRLPRDADEPEEARGVDDVALARGSQVRQERLGAVHDAPEVDADDPLEIGVLDALDRGAVSHAGVV